MLVLSRKVGEKIVIGNNITIVVQRVGKGRVALAIDAPPNVTVLRGELAPFGLEDIPIEFSEGEVEDGEGQADGRNETLPGSDAPNPKVLCRPTARVTPGNSRRREETSTRAGFPPSTPTLNPTSEVSSARLPHTFPSR